MKWILFGSLLAVVPMGYSLYLAFLEPNDFGFGAASWPMLAASAFMTAAFTISITRYRLMQLDQIISRSMAYFLVSFLAGLTYYGVVFLGTWIFSQWIARPSLLQAFGVSSAALVLLLLLDWVRGRVKRVLDRRFYRDKHQLDRTLQRMSQAISQLVDPPTLARRLLQASAELLGVPQGAVDPARGRHAALSAGRRGWYSTEARRALIGLPPGGGITGARYSARPLSARAACRRCTATAPFPGRRSRAGAGPRRRDACHASTGAEGVGSYSQEDLNSLAAFAQITVLRWPAPPAIEPSRGSIKSFRTRWSRSPSSNAGSFPCKASCGPGTACRR